MWVTTGARAEHAVLTVGNTGDRIATESVPRLVEPFLRGTARIRSEHAGVGRDLAIVDSIARAHDGTLTLAPRAGGGLRVTVRLPATSPRDVSPGGRVRRRGGGPGAGVRPANRRARRGESV